MDEVERGILPAQRLFCFAVVLCVGLCVLRSRKALEFLSFQIFFFLSLSDCPNGTMKMLPSILVMTKSIFPWKLTMERKTVMMVFFWGYLEL